MPGTVRTQSHAGQSSAASDRNGTGHDRRQAGARIEGRSPPSTESVMRIRAAIDGRQRRGDGRQAPWDGRAWTAASTGAFDASLGMAWKLHCALIRAARAPFPGQQIPQQHRHASNSTTDPTGPGQRRRTRWRARGASAVGVLMHEPSTDVDTFVAHQRAGERVWVAEVVKVVPQDHLQFVSDFR